MNFLIEVDRYRIFADTVMTQAEDGVYNHAAEALVGQKAKAIINCYIESDIPPKLQVNISPDVAETIVGNYNDQIIERGLFHEATISIFPTLAHLWKKFNAQRIFDSMPPRPLVKHRITPHGSTKIPNYVTMDKVKTKRIISHSDDDCMRILFSLAHGIRHITPHFTHDHELLPKGFSGSQLDLIQYARGLALHHGDSESFISRLTNLVARRNDAAGELSPEYESHAHGRRRKSSMSQLSSRKLIRPPVEHIAVVSRSDLRSEKSATPAGVEMSHLLKLMNPKAYEMT
ncbi:regulator of G-protein signaling protein-like [Lineus longissimus]|uniref:regulator of G-protein signaling protein-like n=1 Tax=Lineus longissimus TaxID=88925 RepID=UPI00315DE49D